MVLKFVRTVKFFFVAPLLVNAIIVTSFNNAFADELLVAVASNFAETAEKLTEEFEKMSSHKVSISLGSTGKLYAQIINGAPFDVLLAADQARPKLLADKGIAVKTSRFTYASGLLVLWSADADIVGMDGAETLKSGKFATLAMANPLLAPYGRAARQVLQRLGLWQKLQGRLVEGQNAGQTFSFVATRNAQLGFVALSYLKSRRNNYRGSRWKVPVDLYEPIRQDAVLIARAANNPAALAFVEYLKSAKARKLIAGFGYGLE